MGQNSAESQDDYNNEGPIHPKVKLAAYDRRRNELRALEAKRDAIQTKGDPPSEDQTRLATLVPVIAKAQDVLSVNGR